MTPTHLLVVCLAICMAVAGCSRTGSGEADALPAVTTATVDSAEPGDEVGDGATTSPPATLPSSTEAVPTTTDPTAPARRTVPEAPPLTRPEWLGTRTLTTGPNGFASAQPTPPELADRRLPTIDTLPPPAAGAGDGTGEAAPPFVSTIGPLDGEPLERSTWEEGCPVPPSELRYVTVSFWGFDGLAHQGELIIAAAQAEGIAGVFEKLYNARFPLEEMRIITPADLDADPTGDSNNTGSFVCRAVTGGTRFSEHAYGLAIDVNPFHNPYLRNEVVLPELATIYTDRTRVLPGMIMPDDVVVQAFADIGWRWGGDWNSLKDWQHFALNNR